MKAFVQLKSHGVKYRLRQIGYDEMAKLLGEPHTATIMGMPKYFDADKRLWPLPSDDWAAVEFSTREDA